MGDTFTNLGDDMGAPLELPIRDIAEKFIELYWQQFRPFEIGGRTTGLVLAQNTGRQAAATKRRTPKWKPLAVNMEAFPSMEVVAWPGHAADLQVVSFRDTSGVVCVASDAVLDREWLLAWQYCWPNVYAPSEIMETWRSLANLLSIADTVIPGHGPPISVTAELRRELIDNFPRAEYGSRCPEGVNVLRQRLERLRWYQRP